MSLLNAISVANRETRQVEADERAREISIRNLHRMRQQDADAAKERARELRAQEVAQTGLPGLVDLGTGSAWSMAPAAPEAPASPATAPGGASAPAERTKRQQTMPGERAAIDIYNVGRLPDQTRAESARLARQPKPTAPGALPRSGYDSQSVGMAQRAAEPAAATARREAERRRLAELLRKNPAQDRAPSVRDAASMPAAAATPSDFDAFKQAIFGQESRNGAVDTSRPNYAGALGKGQILESTFNGLKKQGKLPADYDWRNPAHNEAAAVAYMQEAWQAAGGDPRLAAAYYYGGPKAIAGGAINTYRDLRNPRAPDTHGYAEQVVARMRPGIPAPAAAPTPTQVAQGTEQQQQQQQQQQQPAAAPAFGQEYVGGRGNGSTQDMRILNLQMAELARQIPYAKSAADMEALRSRYTELATKAQQIQVRDAAIRAVQDDSALTALAQAAGTPFAQTAQGFVLVRPGADGQWRPTSPPVDRMALITHVMGVLTGSSAAIAAEQRKSDMKIRENVATEQVKGANAARNEALKHQYALQQLIQRNELQADEIMGVESTPDGKQLVRTRTGVFEVVPSVDLGGGMMSAPSLRPLPMR